MRYQAMGSSSQLWWMRRLRLQWKLNRMEISAPVLFSTEVDFTVCGISSQFVAKYTSAFMEKQCRKDILHKPAHYEPTPRSRTLRSLRTYATVPLFQPKLIAYWNLLHATVSINGKTNSNILVVPLFNCNHEHHLHLSVSHIETKPWMNLVPFRNLLQMVFCI